MTSRGYMDFLKEHPVYTEARKRWYVELVSSTQFWFDLLINPPGGVDIQKMAASYMNQMREVVQASTDKRFVYFIASRRKVRFSERKPPRRAWMQARIELCLEIGEKRKRRKLVFAYPRDLPLPQVVHDGRFLMFSNGKGGSASVSVHDFLAQQGIDIGSDTEVLYVGSTDDPASRPLQRKHRGFGDAVYATNMADRDLFVFYNLYKVLSLAQNPGYGMNFAIGNGVIDEVRKREEGLLLEHALIHYFQTKSQEVNAAKEQAALKNSLKRLLAENLIDSITFDLAMEQPCEFYRFYSRHVPATDRHHFSVSLGPDGEPVIGDPISPLLF